VDGNLPWRIKEQISLFDSLRAPSY